MDSYCGPVIDQTIGLVDRLIAINDGSTDRTSFILKEAHKKHLGKMELIDFPENRGKGVALLEGMKAAIRGGEFSVLVTLDSDGQHLPSEIGKLVQKIEKGADFVIGSRNFNAMPFRSHLGNGMISFLLRCLFSNAPHETQSGFRAFSYEFCLKIVEHVTGSRYEMEFRCLLLALNDGMKIVECPIQTIYLDKNRSSHYSVIRDSFRIFRVLYRYWRHREI